MYDTSGVYEEDDINGRAGPDAGGGWAMAGTLGLVTFGPVI